MPLKDPPLPAVVIGIDCPTGLQTARTLADIGVPVAGVADDRGHPCSRTRACSHVVEADTGAPDLLEALSRLSGDGSASGSVLVPCTDRSVLFLSRHRDEVPGAQQLVLPDADVLGTLLDKALFAEFARERGLPVPPTRVLRSRREAAAAASDLPFPCALKPNRKAADWKRRTDAKLFRAGSPEELIDLYDRCSEWARSLVAQSWVPGPDSQHVTCNAYLVGDEMVAAHTSRKLRQWPRNGGQGCLSESWPDDEVRRIAADLFGSEGYRGLAYLEVKRDPRTGEHLILETNVGRPTGRAAAARASGVPLLETAYRDAAGLALPRRHRGNEEQGVKWVHLRRDAQASAVAALKGELTPSEWLRSLRGPRVYALLSRQDPLPFLLDLARSAGKALRRVADGLRPSPPTETRDDGGRGGRAGRDAEIRGLGREDAADRELEDYDLGGSLTVRLRGPGPADAVRLRSRAGPPATAGSVEPDLVVRFVDRLEAPALRHAEWGRFGFTARGLHLLDGPGGEPVARLDPGAGTDSVKIRCRRGRGAPPLFEELVDLAALKRGLVPLHASAFAHGGRAAIVAGPGHSGKTGALLAFGTRGARFVADDRVLLHPDGSRMTGLRRPLTVRDWHLRQLPELRSRIPLHRRAVSRALGAAGDVVPAGLLAGDGRSRKLMRRVRAGLRRRLAVTMTPDEIFGADRSLAAVAPDVVFLLVNRRDEEISVEPAAPEEAARRFTALVETEMRDLLDAHRAFRFAFPGAAWPPLDDLRARVERTLEGALRDKEAFVVRHPHPCSLQRLYEAMRSALAPGHGPDQPAASVSVRTASRGSEGAGRGAGPVAPAVGGGQ